MRDLPSEARGISGKRFRLKAVLGDYEFRQAGGIGAFAVDPNRDVAYTPGELGVTEWSLTTGRAGRRLNTAVATTSLAVSADGGWLVATGSKGTFAWDLATRRRVDAFPQTQSSAVAVSSTGQALFGDDRRLRLFEVSSGAELAVLKGHRSRVRQVALSACGTLALSGGDDGLIKLHDVARKRVLGKWGGHSDSLSFSADGRYGLSSGYDHVFVFDLANAELIAKIEVTSRAWEPPLHLPHSVKGSAFSPESATIALCTRDSIWLMDWVTHEIQGKIPQPRATRVAFTPDGERLLATGGHTAMALFDVKTRSRLIPDPRGGHLDSVTGIAARKGRLLTASRDWTLREWDQRSGEELRASQGVRSPIRSLVVAGDEIAALVEDERAAHLSLWGPGPTLALRLVGVGA